MDAAIKNRTLKQNSEMGFTWLELITVLLIVSVILSLGIPSFLSLLTKQDKETTLAHLQTALEYGKSVAEKLKKSVILCGSFNKRTCDRNGWSTAFILLLRTEENEPPSVLQVFEGPTYGKVLFSAFGGDHHTVIIQPNGTTINNGTFLYCPKNGDKNSMAALVLNQVGRTYLSQKDSKGNPLFCR